MKLEDGLYRVEHGGLCAGFVVQGGRVIRCAPILRRWVKGKKDWPRWLWAERIAP